MGSLYFWGCSIQEMGSNVVIGRSIYGVVVIDGSLYSQFYGICVMPQNCVQVVVVDLCLLFNYDCSA